MTNAEYAEKNEDFRNACIKAGIPPTKRQASKYRLRSGRAYQFRNGRVLDDNRDLGIQVSQR